MIFVFGLALLFLALFLLLHGCAASETSWKSMELSDQQRAADYAYCKSYGYVGWGGGGVLGLIIAPWMAASHNASVYDACMRAKGWTR